MSNEIPSIRKCAAAYLCLYAFLYPIGTFFLMGEGNGEGTGALPIQLFQISVLGALVLLWKFGKNSLRGSVDVWIVGVIYFSCISWYMALFWARDSQRLEILCAARFISWFFFAAVAARNTFTVEYWEKLARAFWFGTIIQTVLAVGTFVLKGDVSIYRDVYATTGSVNVSGKTVVSFVILGFFLSIYWMLTSRRHRLFYLLISILELTVVLFSFNRAGQLALALALLFVFFWAIKADRFKLVYFMTLVFLVALLFFISVFGETFLTRWRDVVDDQGSGRLTLIKAAWDNFWNPRSTSALILGSGYYQMELLMYRACGVYIGSHCDLFDFLTAYGIVGFLFYFWINVRLLSMCRLIPGNSIENAFSFAAVLFIIFDGLFTGTFQATYTFYMLIAILYYMKTRSSWHMRQQEEEVVLIEEVVEEIEENEDDELEQNGGFLDEKEDVYQVEPREQSAYGTNTSGRFVLNDVVCVHQALSDMNFQEENDQEEKIQDLREQALADILSEEKDLTEQKFSESEVQYDRNHYIDDYFENTEDF